MEFVKWVHVCFGSCSKSYGHRNGHCGFPGIYKSVGVNSRVRPVSPGLELVGESWITFMETQSCHALTSKAVDYSTTKVIYSRIKITFLQKLRFSFE